MTPLAEESDYTSVQDRIVSAKALEKSKSQSSRQKRELANTLRDRFLSPVYLNERSKSGPKVSKLEARASDKGFLPYKLGDYLDFVDWTGRELVRGNKGRIPNNCKPILERVGLNREVWCELVRNFGRLFGRVAGTPDSLQQSATSGGVAQRRSRGGPELLVG